MINVNVSCGIRQVPEDLLVTPLDFPSTGLRGVTAEDHRFIDQALSYFRSEKDARSVAGIHFWKQELGLPTDFPADEALLKSSLSVPILDGIGDFVDRHFRMRGLGMETAITREDEFHVDGMLSEVRGYEDGWSLAHLRYHMPRLGIKVELGPGVHEQDTSIMMQTLDEARAEGDGGMAGWMHLRMRGMGIITDLRRDENLIRQGLEVARESARGGDVAAGLEVLGMHYIISQLFRQESGGVAVNHNLPPLK